MKLSQKNYDFYRIMDLRASVLHKYSYVTPPQLAQRIRTMKVVCQTKSYLDCCIEYNDIQSVCNKFSELYRDGALTDPYVFEQRVTELGPSIDKGNEKNMW
jgi:hypothetical protein